MFKPLLFGGDLSDLEKPNARSIPPAEAPIQSVPDTSPSVCDIAAGTGEESTHIEQE
jgi:hypothetical protein